MNQITIDELMNLSRKEFIDRNKAWQKEFNDNNLYELDNPKNCPLHQWFLYNKAKCPNEMVSLTAQCPLCGNAMCPICNNHNVDQLSRVTGYMAPVSGWGEAKKQEFKDRKRHEV